MSTLFMCGAGNADGVRLAMVCNSHQTRWDRLVVLDDDLAKQGRELIGVPIVGGFGELAQAHPETDQVMNSVARTTKGRAGARSKIASFGVPFAQVVHPGVDTFGAELADEMIVYQNATICPECRLGRGSVVFMGAVVGHECDVSDGCVVASNAVLNARVQLGERVYVGTNATVLPEICIGEEATVAAGSVVIRDIEDGETVIGVPADTLASMAESGPAPGAPRTAMDVGEAAEAISMIWCRLLGVASVEPTVSFFELGGNSQLALQMQERVGTALGTRLATTDIFRFPSIEALVTHLTGTGGGDKPSARDRAAARKTAIQSRRSRPRSQGALLGGAGPA